MEAETSDELDLFPEELLVAQAREALRDAHRVGVYLSELYAILGQPLKDISYFPSAFLLELAAALRLLEWESLGLVRQWMNLPRADETLRSIVLNCGSPDQDLPVSKLVFRTYTDYFSWLALPMVGADIVLDPTSEHQFADAVATFIWKNRKSLGNRHATENRT